MSERDNVRLACAMISAWNARDLRRYLALLSDDCVVESGDEAAVQGHDAAGQMLQRYVNDAPDLWLEITDVVGYEHTVVATWRARGTLWNDMSLAGIVRRPVEVSGFTVVGIKNDKIVRVWYCWDPDELLRRVMESTSAVSTLDGIK